MKGYKVTADRLMPNHGAIHRVLMVAASSGYVWGLRFPYSIAAYALLLAGSYLLRQRSRALGILPSRVDRSRAKTFRRAWRGNGRAGACDRGTWRTNSAAESRSTITTSFARRYSRCLRAMIRLPRLSERQICCGCSPSHPNRMRVWIRVVWECRAWGMPISFRSSRSAVWPAWHSTGYARGRARPTVFLGWHWLSWSVQGREICKNLATSRQ